MPFYFWFDMVMSLQQKSLPFMNNLNGQKLLPEILKWGWLVMLSIFNSSVGDETTEAVKSKRKMFAFPSLKLNYLWKCYKWCKEDDWSRRGVKLESKSKIFFCEVFWKKFQAIASPLLQVSPDFWLDEWNWINVSKRLSCRSSCPSVSKALNNSSR